MGYTCPSSKRRYTDIIVLPSNRSFLLCCLFSIFRLVLVSVVVKHVHRHIVHTVCMEITAAVFSRWKILLLLPHTCFFVDVSNTVDLVKQGNSCALPYCLDQTTRLLLILSQILCGFYLREAFIRGCCLFFYRCIEWHCTHTFTFPGTSDCKPKSGERLLNSSSQCIT